MVCTSQVCTGPSCCLIAVFHCLLMSSTAAATGSENKQHILAGLMSAILAITRVYCIAPFVCSSHYSAKQSNLLRDPYRILSSQLCARIGMYHPSISSWQVYCSIEPIIVNDHWMLFIHYCCFWSAGLFGFEFWFLIFVGRNKSVLIQQWYAAMSRRTTSS